MKKRFLAISAAVLLAAGNVTMSLADDISEYKEELQQNQAKMGEVQNQLNDTTAQKSTAKDEVEKLDAELNQVNSEYEALVQDLDDTNEQLTDAQEELETATTKRESQYETLKSRIRVMYEEGNVGYLEILLNSNSFSDYLNRMEYVSRIMDYDNNLLANFQAIETLINDKVIEIEDCKAELEDLAEQTVAKKAELDSKVEEKLALISKLSSDEATYNQQLADLAEDNEYIKDLIEKAEAKAAAEKAAAEAAAAKAAAQAAAANAASSAAASQTASSSSSASYSSSNKVYSYGGGRFLWPVPAYVGIINDVYGYRSSPISGSGEFHSGLDMRAPYGTDIVAADDGTVIYSAMRNGYGNCVIIDHGGGFSTLYGHNSSLCVSVGQTVVRGQVIAKAGSTGYSTGAHLHFEVRINGQYVDPNPYL
ncbi:MAG: peptidoglycan DD-metalloendopeptidase family protein [Clostridiales bacterium]|nr:peptidoglycan DD-metalloendopeptidase family protein [Clostridiales bacterium]